MITITNVQEADQVEMSWIRENIDLGQAKQMYLPQPRTSRKNRHSFKMPPLGTWRVSPFGDISVLIEIPVNEMEASEQEWDIALRYPETQLYIQWQKEGYEPPPLDVIRTAIVNGRGGNLRSCNRRRWLAAREAGVKSLKCWYSPTHPDHCASGKWDLKYL